MKKNFLSIGAFVIAVLLVAFTQPAKNIPQTDMYVFEFDHTQAGGYSLSNVQDESNTYWKYIGKNLSICGGDEKACRIAVLAANVDNASNPTELRNVEISAELSPLSKAIVNGVTELGSQFGNQPN